MQTYNHYHQLGSSTLLHLLTPPLEIMHLVKGGGTPYTVPNLAGFIPEAMKCLTNLDVLLQTWNHLVITSCIMTELGHITTTRFR
jgi:hypothetical protein